MEIADLPPILIVDDDPLFRLLTRMLLESHGLTVSVAAGCEEAIELLPIAQPGLALVDMAMPQLDGLRTIAALRAVASDLRFIACSGQEEEFFRDRLDLLDVPHFLPKPFTVDVLLAMLRRAMNGRAICGELAAVSNQ